MGEEALKRALIILSMWHVDWISCDFPHCISALGCPWMALSGESSSSDPDWMPLWGLSYKKVRFKLPKVLVIVRVWDVSQQCETSKTLNLRFKHPKLWDVWNVFSYRRDLCFACSSAEQRVCNLGTSYGYDGTLLWLLLWWRYANETNVAG